MASTTPRYDGDCMKLSYAWFPPIIHDIQLGVSGWWFFSWRNYLFVQYVFANNKEITLQALLPWRPLDSKFCGRKKKINIHFTDCLCFYKSVYVYCSFHLFCFILQAVSTVLSTASSWLFCLLLFKHVIHLYSTAKAQDYPCSLCRPG